jgi:hypothetical protein
MLGLAEIKSTRVRVPTLLITVTVAVWVGEPENTTGGILILQEGGMGVTV